MIYHITITLYPRVLRSCIHDNGLLQLVALSFPVICPLPQTSGEPHPDSHQVETLFIDVIFQYPSRLLGRWLMPATKLVQCFPRKDFVFNTFLLSIQKNHTIADSKYIDHFKWVKSYNCGAASNTLTCGCSLSDQHTDNRPVCRKPLLCGSSESEHGHAQE